MTHRIVSTLLVLAVAAGLASAQQFTPIGHDYFPESSLPHATHCFAGTGGSPVNMAAQDCVHSVSFWTDMDLPYGPHAHVFDFDASASWLGGPISSLRFYCEGYFHGGGTSASPYDGDQYELTAIYEAKIQVYDFVNLVWIDFASTFLDPAEVNTDGSTIFNHNDFVYADLWTAPAPTAGVYAGPIDQTILNPANCVNSTGFISVRIQFHGRLEGSGYDCSLVMDEVYVDMVEGATTTRINPTTVWQDDQNGIFSLVGNDGVLNLAVDDALYNTSYFQNQIVPFGGAPSGPYEIGDDFTFDVSSLGITGSQITDLRFYAKAFFSGSQSTGANQVRRSPSGPPTSFTSDDPDELGYFRALTWEVYNYNTSAWEELGPWGVADKRAVVTAPAECMRWDGTPIGAQWCQPGPIAGVYAGPLDLQAGAVFSNDNLSATGELKIRLKWTYDTLGSTGEQDSAHFYDHVFVEVNQMGGHSSLYWPSWNPSTHGHARLTTSGGVARPGNSGLTLEIQDGVPGSLATLFIGFSNTGFIGAPNTLPYDLGVLGYAGTWLAVSAEFQAALPLNASGAIVLPAAIPNNPAFSSGSVYLQAYSIDPALPAGNQLAFTNGLTLQFQP